MKSILKTKKQIGMILMFVVLSTCLFAQGRHHYERMDENRGKIKAHKVAYITDKLNLSSGEAEKFWPIYNENEAITENTRRDFRENHKIGPEQISEISDEDAKLLISDQITHEQEMLDIRKTLYTNLEGVISFKKILILIETEKDFRVQLMRRLSSDRGPGNRQGKGQVKE